MSSAWWSHVASGASYETTPDVSACVIPGSSIAQPCLQSVGGDHKPDGVHYCHSYFLNISLTVTPSMYQPFWFTPSVQNTMCKLSLSRIVIITVMLFKKALRILLFPAEKDSKLIKILTVAPWKIWAWFTFPQCLQIDPCRTHVTQP